jgi:hypothetical protein
MVHIIPLFVGERRLDTGNVVQYPDSSPVGEAVQQFGDRWQAVAERYQQRMAQQQAFDTEIAARRLNGEIAKAEADAVANSPADGAGLHDAVYGQVNPRTGQVVKTGLFDTLFGNFLEQAPPELRAGLASRKETLREAGSWRMAAQQLQRRKQYEQDQVAEVHTAELNNIARSDPNDTAAFDASRQVGLDLLAKMDLDPQIRLEAEADWRASTAKARMEALIAQDPRRAAEMLSAGSVASDGMGETVRTQLAGGTQVGRAAVKGDRLKKSPDLLVAQAFDESPADASTKADSDIPHPFIAGMSGDQIDELFRRANAADTANMINTRADIDRAVRNAPRELMYWGTYSDRIPDPGDFDHAFTAEEGAKQGKSFVQKLEVGQTAHKLHATE